MTTRKSTEVIDGEVDEPTNIASKRAPAKKSTTRRAPAKRAQPHKPAGVKQPQDHKKSAAQREAEGVETITVTWEKLEFEIVADPDEWDFWTVTQPLAAGNHAVGLIGLLGPQQSMKLRAAHPRLTNPQARDLFETINRAVVEMSTGN
ncbi:hypothetical protein [Rhodococcoides fascians]|uniref:hypothetical protein n=1 Tax=Rhodococcoides fascians TaxID=1828 RepID=UPI00055B9DFA|nr:hypothetical protein [Rhodococcus fascians]